MDRGSDEDERLEVVIKFEEEEEEEEVDMVEEKNECE